MNNLKITISVFLTSVVTLVIGLLLVLDIVFPEYDAWGGIFG